jgi:hypothetical protein
MRFNLWASCGVGLLALSLGQGCGEPQPPAIGPNLVSNGSFESGLNGWWSWTDSEEGTASTSAEAADEGSAGLVLTRGAEGNYSLLKQPLPEPVMVREQYRIEADVRGARGEFVNICLQLDHEPWDGPCASVTAALDWQHVAQTVTIDEALSDAWGSGKA